MRLVLAVVYRGERKTSSCLLEDHRVDVLKSAPRGLQAQGLHCNAQRRADLPQKSENDRRGS